MLEEIQIYNDYLLETAEFITSRFTYLGKQINADGTATEAVTHKISRAKQRFINLRPYLKCLQLSVKVTVRPIKISLEPLLYFGPSTT